MEITRETDKEGGVCVWGGYFPVQIKSQPVIYLTVASLGLLQLSVTLLYLTADQNGNKQISYIAIRHIWILSATPDGFQRSAVYFFF